MKLHFLLAPAAALFYAAPIVAASEVGLGGSGLRLATKKKASSESAPLNLSETCGVGTYKCYGEASEGGDYQGPKISSIDIEFGDVKFLENSKFGLMSVNITNPGGFTEYEICRPDPLNGTPTMPFPKYYCVTTVRNDEKYPTVLIDMTFTSCDSWTKIVRNLKANPNNDNEQEPGVFEVRCTKDTLSQGDSFESYV